MTDVKRIIKRDTRGRFVSNWNTVSVEERFWSKVEVRGRDECWPWKAGLYPNGYGAFALNRKNGRAHRFAWQLKNGPIPEELFVLHDCDNPPCCNPAHLFLGTQADNVADARMKNRMSDPPIKRGENHNMARLKNTDIPIIRQLLQKGVSGIEIARRFQVAATTISAIKSGQNWRHIQ